MRDGKTWRPQVKSIRGGNTWSGTVTAKREHSKDRKERGKKFLAKQRMMK
jgi:hypothetical protein